MPEDMPDRMPEDMPDRMPEGMPDRMPDKMSDRMTEDLPVTTCINVMVGITRSKLVFYWRINHKWKLNTVCSPEDGFSSILRKYFPRQIHGRWTRKKWLLASQKMPERWDTAWRWQHFRAFGIIPGVLRERERATLKCQKILIDLHYNTIIVLWRFNIPM